IPGMKIIPSGLSILGRLLYKGNERPNPNRMRLTSLLAILLLTLSIFLLPALLNLILPVNAVSASFSFAASGDIASLTVSTSTTSLNRLATANPSFFLSLGDMSYDPSVTGDVWCGQFASAFSSIEVTPADHDTG